MILDKKIEIKMSSIKRLIYYRSLGHQINYYDLLIIKIEDLTPGSSIKINVKCDICGKEKLLRYFKYFKNTKNLIEPYCCCSKCAFTKNKQTKLDKYKNENYNNLSKTSKTKKERFGDENYNNREKAEETKLKKYGNKKYNNRIKAIATNIAKYGVENPLQINSIFEKQQINGKKLKTHESTGLKYRGTYEKHFLDYCFENNIEVENIKSIKYEFDGKKNKIYYPDFYLREKNLIIEIKSTYIYKRELNKNLAKQKSCIDQDYSFIFIIDKKYDEFLTNYF